MGRTGGVDERAGRERHLISAAPAVLANMLFLPLAAVLLAQASTSAPPSLEDQLRQIIKPSGAEVAVAYRTLDGRTELFLDADKPFHAASTMKVPVMIELFRQAAGGRAFA